MANFKFVVDDVKISDLVSALLTASDTITQYNSDIYTKITELGQGWSGEAYDAFVAQSETHRKSLETLPSLFVEYSKKLAELDTGAGTLISSVKALLQMTSNRRTSPSYARNGGSVGYNLQDTSGDGGIVVEYKIDSFDKAGDAEKQAKEIQLNLQADIEMIDVEIRNIDINLAALDANKANMDPKVYQEARQALISQKNSLKDAREDYVSAKDTIDGLLTDKFWFWQKDGALVEASDAWFGLENDTELASQGVKELNAALEALTPVDVLCETAAVNGLYAMSGGEYMYESFSEGPNVSPYAMMGAFSVAENSGNTQKSDSDPNVTYFNSKSFIQTGMQETGAWNDSTDRVFGQMDAYTNREMGAEDYNGYDSVQIQTDNGPIYMTYGQYVNSSYYKGNGGE